MTQAKALLHAAAYSIRWSILPTVMVWIILMFVANPKFSPAEMLAILFAIFLACGMLLGVRREILKRGPSKGAGK